MIKRSKFASYRLLLILLLLLCVLGIVIHQVTQEVNSEKEPGKAALAPLGTLPDWSELERFQGTMTRKLFLQRLQSVYSKAEGWRRWITVAHDYAVIQYGTETFTLHFATEEQPAPGAVFSWKKKTDLTPTPSQPLAGLHIALDPGHIGGAFAQMEERHLVYGNHEPIQEGTMTLLTAQLLQPLLEQMGAKVSLIRSSNEPVTDTRPRDFTENRDQKNAEKLFYRTSEIRARAERINSDIQPDLVLCLHYNASGSPFPKSGQHFHILLNGAYHPNELAHQDERFQMLQRLLSRTYDEELPLARALAQSFASHSDLPAYEYPPNHAFSMRLADFVWARNLLANRLYQCPVIFLEPYVMNSTEFIARHKEGDYEGYRMVEGKQRLSVYQEYAQAVAEGVLAYYRNE